MNWLLTSALCLGLLSGGSPETRVEIPSEGWILVGDLVTPETGASRALALLLHKAGGDRAAYADLARAMASRGIASLRVDLRGHGESTNLGTFDPEIGRHLDEGDPAIERNLDLIHAGDRDVAAVMGWLDSQPDLAHLPLFVVGASYTGEEMVEAARATRFADAYVALAPGSFSPESIAAIDPSGVPWLFVRAEVELPFFPALFDEIREGSERAEIRVLPGRGHATDLLDRHPGLARDLIDWLERSLPPV